MASASSVLFETITPIFLVVGTSALLGRLVKIDPGPLASGGVYLFGPALVLNSIVQTDMGAGDVLLVVVAATLACAALALVGMGVARIFQFDRALASTFALTICIMNAANFGLPFIEFAFGPAGLERAVLYTVGLIFNTFTVGIYIASRGRASVRQSLRNVLLTPLPYAVVVGLLLNITDTALLGPLGRSVELLGQALVPSALVVLGLQLGRASLRERWRLVLLATGTRYAAGFLVGLAMATLFGFGGLTRQVFVLETSMPAGVFSSVFATEYGGDNDFAAATILVSTLASAPILGLMLAVL